MKKFLVASFWLLMYTGFLALFGRDLIIHRVWNPLSLSTVYMSIAACSLLQFGRIMDKK